MKTNAVNLGPGPPPVNPAPLITLITDFGLCDPYVGVMKGVILGRCPGARLVDLTHQIPPQDVLAARLALEDAHRFFPAGTLHLAVVDPGVGTARAALFVRTPTARFLAPDNGLLSFLEPGQVLELRRLENPAHRLHPVSATFHGRDVFAPAAGALARGLDPAGLGPLAAAMERHPLPAPRLTDTGARGEILTFDHFGNALTSLRATALPPAASKVRVAGATLPLVGTYAAVPRGAPLALVGSGGRLELAVNGGDARRALGLGRGDSVEVGLLDGPDHSRY